MKTKEELAQIKKEYDELVSKIMELDEDDMKMVTGGWIGLENNPGIFEKGSVILVKGKNSLSDEELGSVSGGFGFVYKNEDSPEYDSLFRFKVGDHAEYIDLTLPFIGTIATDGCTVLHRSHDSQGNPCYQCEGIVEWNRNVWLQEFRFE